MLGRAFFADARTPVLAVRHCCLEFARMAAPTQNKTNRVIRLGTPPSPASVVQRGTVGPSPLTRNLPGLLKSNYLNLPGLLKSNMALPLRVTQPSRLKSLLPAVQTRQVTARILTKRAHLIPCPWRSHEKRRLLAIARPGGRAGWNAEKQKRDRRNRHDHFDIARKEGPLCQHVAVWQSAGSHSSEAARIVDFFRSL